MSSKDGLSLSMISWMLAVESLNVSGFAKWKSVFRLKSIFFIYSICSYLNNSAWSFVKASRASTYSSGKSKLLYSKASWWSSSFTKMSLSGNFTVDYLELIDLKEFCFSKTSCIDLGPGSKSGDKSMFFSGLLKESGLLWLCFTSRIGLGGSSFILLRLIICLRSLDFWNIFNIFLNYLSLFFSSLMAFFFR